MLRGNLIMKKLASILILACGLAHAAQPANVLESATNAKTGNTTTLSVGNGSFRKTPDGGAVVTAQPLVIVTDSEGNEIKRETSGADIVVVLTPAQAGPFFTLFAAAYSQQKAEEAEKARLAKVAADEAEAKAKAALEAAAAGTK